MQLLFLMMMRINARMHNRYSTKMTDTLYVMATKMMTIRWGFVITDYYYYDSCMVSISG